MSQPPVGVGEQAGVPVVDRNEKGFSYQHGIGAKVVTHAQCVIFQMPEVAVPHELIAAILDRIQRFGMPPPLVQRG